MGWAEFVGQCVSAAAAEEEKEEEEEGQAEEGMGGQSRMETLEVRGLQMMMRRRRKGLKK